MFPGRSNKSEEEGGWGGGVLDRKWPNGRPILLTPNDPDSRQANPRRKERLPYSKQEFGFT